MQLLGNRVGNQVTDRNHDRARHNANGSKTHEKVQALTGGHADGVAFQLLYPRMLARDHAPRGYVRQLLKDLDMVQDYAGSLKVPTPMTAQAQTLYRMLAHWGHTELDTSAIMKVYDR